MKIQDLEPLMEVVNVCSIECCRCQTVNKYEQESPVQIRKVHARILDKEGWDYGIDDEAEIEGVMCPECLDSLNPTDPFGGQ